MQRTAILPNGDEERILVGAQPGMRAGKAYDGMLMQPLPVSDGVPPVAD